MPFMRNTVDRLNSDLPTDVAAATGTVLALQMSIEAAIKEDQSVSTPCMGNGVEEVYENVPCGGEGAVGGNGAVGGDIGSGATSAAFCGTGESNVHLGRLTLPHMRQDEHDSDSSSEDGGIGS